MKYVFFKLSKVLKRIATEPARGSARLMSRLEMLAQFAPGIDMCRAKRLCCPCAEHGCSGCHHPYRPAHQQS